MPDTVILFDSLTAEQRSAIFDALENLDVDFMTVVQDGQPVQFTESQVSGAAVFRTAQAACVYAGLDTAARLDEAGLL